MQHTLTIVITAIFPVILRSLEFNGDPAFQRFNNFKRCSRCNDEALKRYQVLCEIHGVNKSFNFSPMSLFYECRLKNFSYPPWYVSKTLKLSMIAVFPPEKISMRSFGRAGSPFAR